MTGKLYDFRKDVSDISMSRDHSNLMIVAGDCGKVVVYNMVNRCTLRTMFHPQNTRIDRVLLSLYPLASIVMMSKRLNTVLVYSVNGQMLTNYTPTQKLANAELGTDASFNDFLVVCDLRRF